ETIRDGLVMHGDLCAVDRIDRAGTCPLDAEEVWCPKPVAAEERNRLTRPAVGTGVERATQRPGAEDRPRRVIEIGAKSNMLVGRGTIEGCHEFDHAPGSVIRICRNQRTIDNDQVVAYRGPAARGPRRARPPLRHRCAGKLSPSRGCELKLTIG